jgi:hypothetical protein
LSLPSSRFDPGAPILFADFAPGLVDDNLLKGLLVVDRLGGCGHNMFMTRRVLLKAPFAVGLLSMLLKQPAQAQLRPFRIFIQREERWPDVVGISSCILGKLYVVQDFPTTVGVPIEKPVGSTLELPWRNNQNEISRIIAGAYKAKTREDGDLCWRIQLDQVPERELIEIHIGNYPRNTIGCILLGAGRSTTNGCMITGSGTALQDLRSRYGTPARPIEILIRDA